MTDEELYGVVDSDGGWTAAPKGIKDLSIMLTWCPSAADGGPDTALLTVRGKDHDLNVDQLRALAMAANRAADAIDARA